MSRLSVIVPVYNAERYLHECLDSLITQTMHDIEIIIINDGSSDGSGRICDQYAAKDRRIKVLHKMNEGAAEARKTGISLSSSEYVCFLDSDDYYDKEFCEIMYKYIAQNNADIVECAYRRINRTHSSDIKLYSKSTIKEKNDFIYDVVKNTIVDGNVAIVMWNKVYKRKLIQQSVSDYGNNVLEDYLFNMQYFCGVNKYVYVDRCLVNYRNVSGSLSNTFNKDFYSELLNVQAHKEFMMNKLALNDKECRQLSYQWFYRYVRSTICNALIVKANHKIVTSEYIDNILCSDKMQEIIDKIDNKSREIRLLKNKKNINYINLIRGKAFFRRIKIDIARIKNKLIGNG